MRRRAAVTTHQKATTSETTGPRVPNFITTPNFDNIPRGGQPISVYCLYILWRYCHNSSQHSACVKQERRKIRRKKCRPSTKNIVLKYLGLCLRVQLLHGCVPYTKILRNLTHGIAPSNICTDVQCKILNLTPIWCTLVHSTLGHTMHAMCGVSGNGVSTGGVQTHQYQSRQHSNITRSQCCQHSLTHSN